MHFHPEVMPEAQRRVLKKLGEIIGDRFYLAGGTAIAIQLGHRESVDLDWFTMDAIAEPLGLAASLATAGLGFTVTGVRRQLARGEEGFHRRVRFGPGTPRPRADARPL